MAKVNLRPVRREGATSRGVSQTDLATGSAGTSRTAARVDGCILSKKFLNGQIVSNTLNGLALAKHGPWRSSVLAELRQ